MVQGLKRESRVSQLSPDGFDPQWSPDGTHIAFLRTQSGNHSLWITAADGVGERSVSEGGIMFGGYTVLPYNRVQTQDYQWSPDGRSLIYSAVRGGVSNIWQTGVDGTGEKQLTVNDDKKLLFFGPVFSPDGKTIAWSAMTTEAANRSWSIWILSDGAARQIYQTNSIMRLVGWATMGGQLILKSTEGKKDPSGLPVVSIFGIDPTGSKRQQIATLKAAYFENVALSPDRKTLAFVTRLASGDAIQMMTIENPVPKTLVSNNESRVYFTDLVFAPDGKTIYYGKQANSQVISMINNFK
jgi:Tol biopolymer transport system component